MSDIEFIDGLIVKAPHQKAPEFVKAAISIKRAELIAWLQSRNDEWINADVKVSRNGKWFAAVNTFKKEERAQSEAPARSPAPANSGDPFEDDDLPPF